MANTTGTAETVRGAICDWRRHAEEAERTGIIRPRALGVQLARCVFSIYSLLGSVRRFLRPFAKRQLAYRTLYRGPRSKRREERAPHLAQREVRSGRRISQTASAAAHTYAYTSTHYPTHTSMNALTRKRGSTQYWGGEAAHGLKPDLPLHALDTTQLAHAVR